MADIQTPMATTQSVSPMAHGITVFAGHDRRRGLQAVEGLAGIVNDQYIVVLPNYVCALDISVWGWLHLLVGLALLVIGIS